ncbi:DUF4003 family protein [Sporosarcina sp. HYO08]|uniref:DUF4003 family protein n=1 Tax=Sporosarcina sp. HYO08 TaxID=1759557 RepID=UPI00079797B2|nr:DUF4003 family protein [Sporosarcina sp. HYO08]KXH80682.1 hypothetical protein AU377_08020 [Sporosarcina sp. HYO08]
MGAKGFRQEVEMTYDKVKSLAGWTVDKNVVLTVASYYATSEREFEAVRLNQAMDALKQKSGWFSPIRGSLLPVIAAFIDRPGTSIDDEVKRLFEKQQVLRSVGFRNTIYAYLAALLLTDDAALYQQEAHKAKKLYDAMKKQHYFLTSYEDYAYAVLLSKKGEDPTEHAKSMRKYYDALRAQKFRSGNELQWLSQVLTYLNISFDEQLVTRTVVLREYFQKVAKVRPIHYPMIGFLTVFEFDEQQLHAIVELTQELEQSKLLKWNREMALSIAMGCRLKEYADNADATSVSLATSVELILQAQQAVIAATVAAMAASSAASSSSSN